MQHSAAHAYQQVGKQTVSPRVLEANLLSRAAYGPRPGETLDIFLPEGRGPWPVHVFVHGGYWRSLDKEHFSFVARGLQPAGVLVAVVNYALIPTVDMDELVRQVRASVAWLHRNVAALGGDPDNITVSGHSAGGHLTAMLLSTDWPAF